MIDIHAHIIPGVDDGAQDLDISLAMARDAATSGVRAMIATPHCGKPGERHANFFSQRLLNQVAELQQILWEQEIDLRLYPGMEVFATGAFYEWLQTGKLLTLAGSRYLLVEFYFDESPAYIERTLRMIQEQGLIPVVAHPERYYCVQWEPELGEKWKKQGSVLQLNRGSIQGKLGQQAMKCAWELLQNGVPQVVASDAHGHATRRPEMKSLMLELGQQLSWDYAAKLLIENPRSILRNAELDCSLQLPDYMERK